MPDNLAKNNFIVYFEAYNKTDNAELASNYAHISTISCWIIL